MESVSLSRPFIKKASHGMRRARMIERRNFLSAYSHCMRASIFELTRGFHVLFILRGLICGKKIFMHPFLFWNTIRN
jgi:hypothetical protein